MIGGKMSIKASGYMILAIDSPPHTQIVSLLFFNPFYRCGGGGGERRNFPPDRGGRPGGAGGPLPPCAKSAHALFAAARARGERSKRRSRAFCVSAAAAVTEDCSSCITTTNPLHIH